ncbi:MAG: hypothetical protein EAZ37_03265 [Burkholderiales bacterium]|nr:MAG: hypothetical protein EAZ37_03265 [Burkholderiales bacterium]
MRYRKPKHILLFSIYFNVYEAPFFATALFKQICNFVLQFFALTALRQHLRIKLLIVNYCTLL